MCTDSKFHKSYPWNHNDVEESDSEVKDCMDDQSKYERNDAKRQANGVLIHEHSLVRLLKNNLNFTNNRTILAPH